MHFLLFFLSMPLALIATPSTSELNLYKHLHYPAYTQISHWYCIIRCASYSKKIWRLYFVLYAKLSSFHGERFQLASALVLVCFFWQMAVLVYSQVTHMVTNVTTSVQRGVDVCLIALFQGLFCRQRVFHFRRTHRASNATKWSRHQSAVSVWNYSVNKPAASE